MSKELLLVVDAVANEKGVPHDVIFEAIEAALASAAKKRYHDEDVLVRVSIDRKDGSYETFRRMEVVADDVVMESPDRQIRLMDAVDEVEGAEVGDFIEEQIENPDFGRIAAQAAKQVIVQRVREAERAQVVDQWKDRVGELVTGIVKRVERGNIYVDLGGNAEAFIPKDKGIPRDVLRAGDRVNDKQEFFAHSRCLSRKSGSEFGGKTSVLLARLLRRGHAERDPVRDQARLVDVLDRHGELFAVDVEHDVVAVDAQDPALQLAASVLRQLQADLGAFAEEAGELADREQRPVDAGRRHLQGVMAGDRIGHVQLRRHFTAHRFAVLDPDRAFVRLRRVDVQAQHRATGRRQVFDAKQLQPQRLDGRGQQCRDFGCLFGQNRIPGNKKGPVGPLVQSPALSAGFRRVREQHGHGPKPSQTKKAPRSLHRQRSW